MLGLGLGLTLAAQRAGRSGAVSGLEPVVWFQDGTAYIDGQARAFGDMFTFSRASTASYVDATGLLRQAAPGQPRLTHHVYENGNWVAAGFLAEGAARTNLNPHGSALGNWTGLGLASITDAAATGPDGALSLTRMVAIPGSGDRGVRRNLAPSVTVGNPVTVSGYFARGQHRYAGFWGFGNGGTGVAFDLQTDTAQINGNWLAAGVEPHGPNLVRAWATCIPQADAFCYIGFFDSLAGSKTMAGGEVLDLGCVQVENARDASSYIPTSGAAATRDADQLAIPASVLPVAGGMPGAISWSMRGRIRHSDSGLAQTARFCDWSDGSGHLRTDLDTSGVATGAIVFRLSDGTVSQAVTSAAGTYPPATDQPFAVAARFGTGLVNGAVDGTVLVANSGSATLPNLAAQPLNLLGGEAGIILQSFRLWDADIGDPGLAEATM